MSDWNFVAKLDEIIEGNYKVVDVDDVQIAVFNLAGNYYAIEDICTHDGGELTGGEIEGDQIVCPRHGAKFCIKTGEALCPPAYEPTAVFPIEVRADGVYVRDNRWD